MENKNYPRLKEQNLFLAYLKKNTATVSMASSVLRIKKQNAISYKRTLERKGQLLKVFVSHCQITKRQASYLSTNIDLINSIKRATK